jgi:hypothetical protein
MVNQDFGEPRCEWDDSIVLRRLVARAWADLACTSAPDQSEPAGEKER